MALASAAGWTVAFDGSNTPARCCGDPERRATSCGLGRWKVPGANASARATTSSQAPSCAAVVAVHSQPPRRNSASGACSEQKFSISSIAASDARTSRNASPPPNNVVKLAIFGHQVITKPPLRPDAPPPHTSASTMQTSTAGSRRLIMRAVHSPTDPPPTMATSPVTAPRKEFGSSAVRASACSSQNERCMTNSLGVAGWAESVDRRPRWFHDHIAGSTQRTRTFE